MADFSCCLEFVPEAFYRILIRGDVGFDKLYGELYAWAGPMNLTDQLDLKTFNVYHDDPCVTEEEKLRLSVGLSVSPETKVNGQIGKMDLDGGKYVVARFELGPMDY